MKLWSDWGFSRTGWRNSQRGEYWVVAQALLITGFVLLPVYRPLELALSPEWLYFSWAIAGILGVGAIAFFIKGILDLGNSLTPLPYPREDGQLVQTGVYAIVRHPLYSGLILAALGWTVFQFSLPHLVGALMFVLFFDAKAAREENWLMQKYPDYATYRQTVKKLIPWLY
ncbi:isoprenylcysteine carboxylmethyltransferase family protein [Cyanobacteria bacterium FACHB-471]|nr:isoprenylcysteine carboxylmethyltransferase family protein [Cyanobacteria bacterium FACHB-471]